MYRECVAHHHSMVGLDDWWDTNDDSEALLDVALLHPDQDVPPAQARL